MRKTLLSFAGFHDPYTTDAPSGPEQAGPVLTLVREVGFDSVTLFRTPGAYENTSRTENALRESDPTLEVVVEDMALLDPTDYAAIFLELRRVLRGIAEKDQSGDVEFFVGLASGTPQMHAAWLLLVASGELPARILITRPARFVTEQLAAVNEVDVYTAPFPAVRSYVAPKEEHSGDKTAEFDAALREEGIVGEHPSMRRVLERAAVLASTKYPVLISGETGTGKELLARFIHRLSGRDPSRFIPVNCAAIPKDLLESTLFGHRKGAFTGAQANQTGKFDVAHGGTLFLDELGELSPELQPKLLRVLQDSIVEPVGAPSGHRVDVRLIAATNIDVQSAIKAGELREDLYYRLKVGTCHIPPLRHRRSDIPRLALFFLDHFNTAHGKGVRFSAEAMTWLRQQHWPGNIRELQNAIDSAALFANSEIIDVKDLAVAMETTGIAMGDIPEPAEGFDMQRYLGSVRERLIERALEIAGGRQNRASRLLGVTPQALSKFRQTKGDSIV